MKQTAVIIARCSTNETKQDVSRQIKDLTDTYAGIYEIIHTYSYYKSGLDNDAENKEILKYVIENKVQNVLVTEVSRVSRKISSFSLFLEACNDASINLIIDNYKLHTFIKGKENTMAQAMLQIAAVMARNELELTKERLNSGRKKYIAEGGKLGRNFGTNENKNDFLSKYPKAIRYLKSNKSVREVMKLCDLSSGTVQKIKKYINEKEV